MRSESFKNKTHGRYWWFLQTETSYVPPIFSFLNENEWKIMEEWYNQTEELDWASECNVPIISFLQGLIMGSSIKNILQLGNYVGYSALLIGFMMKKMGFRNSFVTIDADSASSSVTQYWINKSELNNHVKIIKSNSTNSSLPKEIITGFGNEKPKLLFINNSYQYEQTIEELSLWYDYIDERGIIIIHNANKFASQYDATQKGGVSRALSEWSLKKDVNYFILNSGIEQDRNYLPSELTYKDLGGFAIIQK